MQRAVVIEQKNGILMLDKKMQCSIHQLFKVLSLCANASSQPLLPLFSGFINDALLQLSPDAGKALLQIICVPNHCLIDAFLYQPPDPIVNWIEVR